MRRDVFLCAFFLSLGSIYAQSCPAINFYSAQELLPPAGNIILVERQPDGSFNELVVGSQLNRTIPNIQNSVAGCLPPASHGGARQDINFNPTGTASQDGAVADLNGNGIPELVVAINPPEITIYYDLDQTKPFHYLPGIEPAGVGVGDLNGDHKPDLAVVDTGGSARPGGIWILINKGDGTFDKGVMYAVGGRPKSVAIADVNGDGKPDLAVANFSTAGVGSSISVLLGNGDGTFQNAVNYPLSSPGNSVAIADFNGDGKPDLAVATGQSRSITILLGDGKGGFGAAASFLSGGDSEYVAVGDFNGDGKLDLAAGNNQSQTVSILLGKGDGSFAAPASYAAGYGPNKLVVTDFNNDGIADILVGDGDPNTIGENNNSETIAILLGNGDGTFQSAPSYPSTGSSAEFIAVADFNGDGKLDAVLGGRFVPNLAFFAGNGGGAFGAAAAIPLTAGARSAAVADFNGDGKPDLAVAEPFAGSVAVLLNSGGGTFQAQPVFPSGGSRPFGIVSADFNRDGKADLAVVSGPGDSTGGASTLAIFVGGGTGFFTMANTYGGFGQSFGTMAAADLDGDGKPDLVISDSGVRAGTFSGMPDVPGALYFFRNTGGGSFAAPVKYTASMFPGAIAIGDVNGDGKPDLAVATGDQSNYQLAVLLGNGNGTFQPAVLMPTDFGPSAVAIRDFNGDGKADIVVAHCCGATDMTYFLGHGDGAFDAERHFNGGNSPRDFAVADLNGDGKPDLLVAGNAGTLTPLLNVSPAASTALGIVSNASYAKDSPLTAESIASAFGARLATQTSSATTLGTSLGGTTVTVKDANGTDRAALIFFVSPGQVNFEIPAGTANGTASVTVRSGDGVVSSGAVQIVNISPGIYTANAGGLAAAFALHVKPGGAQTYVNVAQLDASQQVIPNPIDLDPPTDSIYLLLFGTGFRHALSAADVTVTVGGAPVQVIGIAAQGQYAGLDQINVLLPYSLKGSGDVAVKVTVGGQPANIVRVTIK